MKKKIIIISSIILTLSLIALSSLWYRNEVRNTYKKTIITKMCFHTFAAAPMAALVLFGDMTKCEKTLANNYKAELDQSETKTLKNFSECLTNTKTKDVAKCKFKGE